MKKYSFLVALLASAFFFTSCEEEAYWNEYEEAEGTVYTFDQATATYELDATETQIVVNLTRSNTSGELTVPVSVTIDDAYSQCFTAPESATFANGSTTAEYVIAFEGLEIGTKYNIALALAEDANVSVTGTSNCDITLNLKYTWVEFGTAEMNETFWPAEGTVDVIKTEGFPIYRVLKPYYGFLYDSDGNEYTEALYEKMTCPYIEFRVNEDGSVKFETFLVDTYDGTNMVYGFWPSDLAASVAGFDEYSMLLDEKTVQLAPYYYVPGLGGWGVNPIIFTLNGDATFLE